MCLQETIPCGSEAAREVEAVAPWLHTAGRCDILSSLLASFSEPPALPEAVAGQGSAPGSAAGFLNGADQHKPWSVWPLMC